MKLTKLVTALGMLAFAGSASAITYYPVTQFQDDDVEYVLDANGAFKTTGNLAVGDTLIAVLEIADTANLAGSGSSNIAALGQELTGLSAIQIYDVIDVGADDNIANAAGETIIFGPSASFTATYGAGAMVAFFLDNTNDLDLLGNTNCTSTADCVTKAIGGNPVYLTAGFGLDPDEAWASVLTGPGNLATIAAGGQTSTYAIINFALSVLTNNTGKTFADQALDCSLFPCPGDGKTTLFGSGTIQGGTGLPTNFIARSDFDFQVAPIPEPSVIALMGMGLLGMGIARDRKSVV